MCYYICVFADPVTYICMKNTGVANLAVWVASDFALAGMRIIFTMASKITQAINLFVQLFYFTYHLNFLHSNKTEYQYNKLI